MNSRVDTRHRSASFDVYRGCAYSTHDGDTSLFTFLFGRGETPVSGSAHLPRAVQLHQPWRQRRAAAETKGSMAGAVGHAEDANRATAADRAHPTWPKERHPACTPDESSTAALSDRSVGTGRRRGRTQRMSITEHVLPLRGAHTDADDAATAPGRQSHARRRDAESRETPQGDKAAAPLHARELQRRTREQLAVHRGLRAAEQRLQRLSREIRLHQSEQRTVALVAALRARQEAWRAAHAIGMVDDGIATDGTNAGMHGTTCADTSSRSSDDREKHSHGPRGAWLACLTPNRVHETRVSPDNVVRAASTAASTAAHPHHAPVASHTASRHRNAGATTDTAVVSVWRPETPPQPYRRVYRVYSPPAPEAYPSHRRRRSRIDEDARMPVVEHSHTTSRRTSVLGESIGGQSNGSSGTGQYSDAFDSVRSEHGSELDMADMDSDHNSLRRIGTHSGDGHGDGTGSVRSAESVPTSARSLVASGSNSFGASASVPTSARSLVASGSFSFGATGSTRSSSAPPPPADHGVVAGDALSACVRDFRQACQSVTALFGSLTGAHTVSRTTHAGEGECDGDTHRANSNNVAVLLGVRDEKDVRRLRRFTQRLRDSLRVWQGAPATRQRVSGPPEGHERPCGRLQQHTLSGHGTRDRSEAVETDSAYSLDSFDAEEDAITTERSFDVSRQGSQSGVSRSDMWRETDREDNTPDGASGRGNRGSDSVEDALEQHRVARDAWVDSVPRVTCHDHTDDARQSLSSTSRNYSHRTSSSISGHDVPHAAAAAAATRRKEAPVLNKAALQRDRAPVSVSSVDDIAEESMAPLPLDSDSVLDDVATASDAASEDGWRSVHDNTSSRSRCMRSSSSSKSSIRTAVEGRDDDADDASMSRCPAHEKETAPTSRSSLTWVDQAAPDAPTGTNPEPYSPAAELAMTRAIERVGRVLDRYAHASAQRTCQHAGTECGDRWTVGWRERSAQDLLSMDGAEDRRSSSSSSDSDKDGEVDENEGYCSSRESHEGTERHVWNVPLSCMGHFPPPRRALHSAHADLTMSGAAHASAAAAAYYSSPLSSVSSSMRASRRDATRARVSWRVREQSMLHRLLPVCHAESSQEGMSSPEDTGTVDISRAETDDTDLLRWHALQALIDRRLGNAA